MIPLTYAQELLDLVERHAPGRTTGDRFVVEQSFRITGVIEAEPLRLALGDVVARHEALRSVREPGGSRVEPPGPVSLDGYADPFPAGDLPALRARLAGDRLDLAAHHSAADPWSVAVIVRDVATAYHARLRGDRLSPKVMQYAEIAADDRSPQWQRRIAEVLPSWRTRLAGIGAVDRPGCGPVTGAYAELPFRLGDGLWQAVVSSARRARSTPFTVLLSAYAATLYPAGLQAEALLPVITPGRIPSEWDTVGFLLNVLTMRVPMPTSDDPPELARRVDAACRQAYADDIPLVPVLGEVPELLAVLAGTRAAPAFRFVARPPMTPPIVQPLWTARPAGPETPPSVVLGCPLLFTLHPGGSGIVTYDVGAYSADRVGELVSAYLRRLPSFTGAA
ncbi:condensation domain-containing protein [Hamadaea sp. NPDC050747]|uniref:condensation domain-containing protein n=1 Tax=Hamadaea sp. NPDC050747 TaxID=3155789 RepID=UPI0033F657C5